MENDNPLPQPADTKPVKPRHTILKLGIVVAGLACISILLLVLLDSRPPWVDYSTEELEKSVAKGQHVFIVFRPYDQPCEMVDNSDVGKLVRGNRIKPMRVNLVHNTIYQDLGFVRQQDMPVVVIIPKGQRDDAIVLKGRIDKTDIVSALEAVVNQQS